MQTKKLSLDHIIKTPKVAAEKSPVLFLFHGYGSNEEDLFSFAAELPDTLFIVSVRAPRDLPPYGYSWYDIHYTATDKTSDDGQAIESRDAVANFIDEVVENYPVDGDNVSLLGFSQGTVLSYAVAFTYPEKVKNVIAISGYLNHKIFDFSDDKDYKNLDFYCSHGSVDQVIPVEAAREIAPFMEANNLKYFYEEFPVGHGVAPQNFHSFKAWLEKRI
ncbi:phospholipase [Kordia sp. YSTF-M3]|uniref:Phospholipase n=1 Tax=Kordia aestuariivivens TaxID=2759037 RepID=A0ABR7QG13_9FLAO|nr:alpha/beta hydrolase-fold protein [Kordia aestuariivivens]MBC8757428.1 phospholipase [Kordia aestuariivivens]